MDEKVSGISVHDNKIEILGAKNTEKIYRAYNEKYDVKDRYQYCPKYYEVNGIEQIDNEYLSKCLKLNGCSEERIQKILKERDKNSIG